MTGTPAGTGFTRTPATYLKHGDRVQVWVGGGIGSCVNAVIEEGKDNKAKL
jgi:2-keto-4-pentenoate hydratase/2-oxohepta-3-ene-1,7-dioic acid hydratase in catechol pathway